MLLLSSFKNGIIDTVKKRSTQEEEAHQEKKKNHLLSIEKYETIETYRKHTTRKKLFSYTMKKFENPCGFASPGLQPIRERDTSRDTQEYKRMLEIETRQDFKVATKIENTFFYQRFQGMFSPQKNSRLEKSLDNMRKNGRTGRRQANFLKRKQQKEIIKAEERATFEINRCFEIGERERAGEVYRKEMRRRENRKINFEKEIVKKYSWMFTA